MENSQQLPHCTSLEFSVHWDSSTGGCRGEASPPKPAIFPPKVIHEKYLVIHEKYENYIILH